MSLLAPIEALYLHRLSTHYELIGLALGIGSLSFLIFSPIFGKLSDKIGRKKIILLCFLLRPFIPLFLIFSPTIHLYIFFKIIAGVLAVGDVIIFALVGDWLERRSDKGLKFGIFLTGPSIGGAIGSLISGSVAYVFSLVIPYFISFFVSLLSSLFLVISLRYTVSPKEAVISLEKRTFKLPAVIIAVITLGVIASFCMSMRNILWPFLIKTFKSERYAPLYTALIFASMGIIAGVLSPFVGKLSDKHGAISIFFLGWLLMGIFGILFGFADNVYMLWLLSIFYSVGETMKGPPSTAIITEHTTRSSRGFVFGIVNSLSSLASFLGPFVTGILMEILDWRFILLIYGFVILFLGILFLNLTKRSYHSKKTVK